MHRTVIVLAIGAAAFAAACSTPPRTAVPNAAPIAIASASIESRDLAEAIEAGGVVRARNTALIASRVMAPIVDVRVRAGDRVRQNAVLVTLETRGIEANRLGAQAAAVAAAESARAAGADVRASESAVTLARATHDRIASLHARRSATAEELDRAVAALAAAESQQAGAQARLAAAAAARDAAEAASESAAVTASYGALRAPFDGVVAERRADPGSMAAPGAPLLVIEDPRAYRLEVQMDESRAATLHTGDRADVRLDAEDAGAPEWTPSRITEIARVDPASHSFLVKIDVPETAALRSGLFGRARFAGPARRTLVAPASAIVRRGQLTFVFLLDSERRARLRPVAVGTTADDSVEVLAGVTQGDAVVVNPPATLSDGSPTAGAER